MVFAKKGILAATVKDVAAEAGVTDAAIYRHWKSKSAMAKELFLESLDRWTSAAKAKNRPWEGISPQPFAMVAEDVVSAIFDYFLANRDECEFVLAAQHGFPDEEYLEAGKNPFDAAAGILFRSDSRKVSQACAGAAIGVVNQMLALVVSGRVGFLLAKKTAIKAISGMEGLPDAVRAGSERMRP